MLVVQKHICHIDMVNHNASMHSIGSRYMAGIRFEFGWELEYICLRTDPFADQMVWRIVSMLHNPLLLKR